MSACCLWRTTLLIYRDEEVDYAWLLTTIGTNYGDMELIKENNGHDFGSGWSHFGILFYCEQGGLLQHSGMSCIRGSGSFFLASIFFEVGEGRWKCFTRTTAWVYRFSPPLDILFCNLLLLFTSPLFPYLRTC